jgi:hypothetical protein
MQTEFDPQSLLKLKLWWKDARRHAAQYFWSSSQDSTTVYLVTGVYKARRIAWNANLPRTTAIRVPGFLNQSNKPVLPEGCEWQEFQDEDGLKASESEEPKTFVVNMLGYRLFRIEDSERPSLRKLSEAVWR